MKIFLFLCSLWERWQSGRMHWSWKPAYSNVPGVRIPLSPQKPCQIDEAFYFWSMKLIFRIVAFLEGVSYILLMTLGLYFKYELNDDSFVKLLGMPHGVLFILYIIFAFILRKKENWNLLNFSIILFASLIPFGTFYIDRKFLLN